MILLDGIIAYEKVIIHRTKCDKWGKEFCLDCFGGGLNLFVEKLKEHKEFGRIDEFNKVEKYNIKEKGKFNKIEKLFIKNHIPFGIVSGLFIGALISNSFNFKILQFILTMLIFSVIGGIGIRNIVKVNSK